MVLIVSNPWSARIKKLDEAPCGCASVHTACPSFQSIAVSRASSNRPGFHPRHLYRDAVQHRIARRGINKWAGAEQVDVDAGMAGCHLGAGTGRTVTPAMRQRDNAGPNVIGDQHQWRQRSADGLLQPRYIAQHVRRCQLDAAGRRGNRLIALRPGRAEQDAVGLINEVLQRQAAGLLAKAVAERAGAYAQVENALRAVLRVQARGWWRDGRSCTDLR